jgi:hypothetical protein
MTRGLCVGYLTLIAALAGTQTTAFGQSLEGHLERYNVLLGASWSCKIKTPYRFAMPGDSFVLTFRPDGAYALHEGREPSPTSGYTFDGYFSYHPGRKTFSFAMADSSGYVELLHSKDGISYSGRGWWQDQSFTIDRTYNLESDKSFTVHEVSDVNGPNTTLDYTCIREK